MPALFSFEWRIVLTVVVEVVLASVLIVRFTERRRRRVSAFLGLAVVLALEGVAYDLLWAPPVHECRNRVEAIANRRSDLWYRPDDRKAAAIETDIPDLEVAFFESRSRWLGI